MTMWSSWIWPVLLTKIQYRCRLLLFPDELTMTRLIGVSENFISCNDNTQSHDDNG